MRATSADPADLSGLELVDRRGERLGRVRQVYPDSAGHPGWAGVRGNLLGTTEALVPLEDAEVEDGVVAVPVSRARFLSAPRRTPDVPVDDEEQEQLRLFYADPAAISTRPAAVVAPALPEPPPTPSAPAEEVVVSEQRLRVATEPVPATRVVLRRVVVTEQRTVTVPVRREEVRLVREPIADGVAVPGTTLDESEQEFVLHEERVVVTTEVVPVERVRLVREVVVEDRDVSGEVWREQIEADAGGAPAAPGGAAPAPAAPTPAAPTPAAPAPDAGTPAATTTDDAAPAAKAAVPKRAQQRADGSAPEH